MPGASPVGLTETVKAEGVLPAIGDRLSQGALSLAFQRRTGPLLVTEIVLEMGGGLFRIARNVRLTGLAVSTVGSTSAIRRVPAGPRCVPRKQPGRARIERMADERRAGVYYGRQRDQHAQGYGGSSNLLA